MSGTPGAALFICVAFNLTTVYFLSATPPSPCHIPVPAETWQGDAGAGGPPGYSCAGVPVSGNASGYCTNVEAASASNNGSSGPICAVAGTCSPYAWRVEEVQRCRAEGHAEHGSGSGGGSGCREQCWATGGTGGKRRDDCAGPREGERTDKNWRPHELKRKHTQKHKKKEKKKKKKYMGGGSDRGAHRRCRQAQQWGEGEGVGGCGHLVVPGAAGGGRVLCRGLAPAVLSAAREALAGAGVTWGVGVGEGEGEGEIAARCRGGAARSEAGAAARERGRARGGGGGRGGHAVMVSLPACASSSAVAVVDGEGEGVGSGERQREGREVTCVDPTADSEQCLVPFIRSGGRNRC